MPSLLPFLAQTSGLLRFDATGNSVGKREQDQAQQNTASQIVSLGKGGDSDTKGSVNLNAMGNTTVTGSSVLAPAGDIRIIGANVVINDAQNTATHASQTHAKEIATTAQLKRYVDAARGAYESVQTARDAKQDTGSDRMAGLAALNAIVSVYNASMVLVVSGCKAHESWVFSKTETDNICSKV